MRHRKYSIRIHDRGESIAYVDADVELLLERTHVNGHRLYCTSTSTLPFEKRREITENLCEYFETKTQPTIYVLDEADRDRNAFETLFAELAAAEHKIIVELDSAERRRRAEDEMYLGILKAGTKLSIGGVDIGNEQEYWRWRRDA